MAQFEAEVSELGPKDGGVGETKGKAKRVEVKQGGGEEVNQAGTRRDTLASRLIPAQRQGQALSLANFSVRMQLCESVCFFLFLQFNLHPSLLGRWVPPLGSC